MELEQAKKEAENEKNAGNEFFRTSKFGPAIQHYTKAIELDPTNAVSYQIKIIKKSLCIASNNYTRIITQVEQIFKLNFWFYLQLILRSATTEPCFFV